MQSWGSKVNAQDNVGNTPLHLAVRSADHFPNTRSIKELLIKGAARSITEENGLKPIDLVDEIEDEQKRRELIELLKEPGFYIPCCHFRQPMKKIEQNNNTLACFVVLTWGTYIALLAFVHPCKSSFFCDDGDRHLLGWVVFDSNCDVLNVVFILRNNSEETAWFYARDTADTVFKTR